MLLVVRLVTCFDVQAPPKAQGSEAYQYAQAQLDAYHNWASPSEAHR